MLLAGRSASAFAAEVGAMKMNQEIDAMRVMGIDPYEALVVPRLLALVIMQPLVTMILGPGVHVRRHAGDLERPWRRAGHLHAAAFRLRAVRQLLRRHRPAAVFCRHHRHCRLLAGA
ncbi:MAG: ABC transporter permease [Asticcacaulis sp.]